MITRTQGLCWSTNLFINPHSCKQDFSQKSRQAHWKLYFIYLVAKSFCWPSFLHYQTLLKQGYENWGVTQFESFGHGGGPNSASKAWCSHLFFHCLHNHTPFWETGIFGFLCPLDFCSTLVMVTWIIDFCFYAEDYCDGAVI
jgi:hypothetical protein